MTDELKGTVAARVLYMALTLNSETWAPSPGDGDWRWRMTVPVADLGKLAEACGQLRDALNRTDGNPKPPDFVTGPDAAKLAEMIRTLRTDMSCP